MKTYRFFFSAFALLFGIVTSSFTIPAGNGPASKPVIAVKYQVDIHFQNDISLCNFYVVEMRDEKGLLVAPPQSFRPGVATYTFIERGPATGPRTAWLTVNTMIGALLCPVELYTAPFSISGTFQVGTTYHFHLFPSTHPAPPVPGNDGNPDIRR